MNKNLKLFLALAVCLILSGAMILGGCSKFSSLFPEKMRRYYNADQKFSIQLPDSWEKQDGAEGIVFVGVSPVEDSSDVFQENINVVSQMLPQKIELEKLFTDNIEQLRSIAKNFFEEERGQTSIAGSDARWIIFSSGEGQIQVRILMYMFLQENRAFAINCVAISDKFPKYKYTFQRIAKSLRFEKF
ncbi:MAG: PsbP-related protein [Candidatus Omnitrophota bacterium]